jgi:hypothetical protein
VRINWAFDRFKCRKKIIKTPMDEDLSEVFQLIAEDERRRRYLKEVGDWLIEEYFELHQAS